MTDRSATITAPSPIVQTIRAYARATTVAHGRPALALGDRAVTTASPDLPELAHLAEEADGYARAWRAQEAARALTARTCHGAARLLRLALTELEATR